MPPNSSGPRIRIFGKTVHAEAGLESHRLDTLFVFRLIPRFEPPPDKAPVHFARFETLLYNHAEELDPIGHIFADAPKPTPKRLTFSAPDGVSDAKVLSKLRISEPLRLTLANSSEAFPASFFPRALVRELTPDVLRTTWKQLVENVRRRPSVTTREDLILSGVTAPRDLTQANLQRLGIYLERVFIADVLEQSTTNPKRTVELAAEFGRSVLPTDESRALLWAAAVSERTPTELRDQIVLLGEAIAPLPTERERPWWDAICAAEVSARQREHSSAGEAQALAQLAALIQRADDTENSLAVELASWALEMRSLLAPPAPDASPVNGSHVGRDESVVSISAPAPEGPPPEHRAAVEAWTLRQRGFSRSDLDDFRSELDSIREVLAANLSGLRSIEGLGSLPALGQALRDLLERRQGFFAEEAAANWRRALRSSFVAFGEASDNVGSPSLVAQVIANSSIDSEELRASAQMFAMRDKWSLLPAWWWAHLGALDEPERPREFDDESLLGLFCQASVRNLTERACQRLSELDSELLVVVREIRPPSRGTTLEDHLASELSALSSGFGHARTKYAGSLTQLLDVGKLDREQFTDAVAAVDELEQRMSPSAFDSLCARCARCDSVEALSRYLRATERSLKQLVQLVPAATAEERRNVSTSLRQPG